MPKTQLTDSELQQEFKKTNTTVSKNLKGQKKVKVYGNQMFQQYLGKQFTWLLNGNPVSIKFDGTYQEYPESVAKLLEEKLSATAVVNSPMNTNVKI